MSKIETISIKDDDLDDWQKAKEQYENLSAKIVELVKQDLDNIKEDEEDREILHLIRNSDWSNSTKKIAHKLLRQGVKEKNTQQWPKFCEKAGVNREDFSDKARNQICNSSFMPYEKQGRRGIKQTNVECVCGAKFNAKAFSKSKGDCPNCDASVFLLKDEQKKVIGS